MCVDFIDLNKSCPNDSFLLPRVDQLVDAMTGHKMLNFIDAFFGYNQISMYEPDQDKMTFITDCGLYYFKVMPYLRCYKKATDAAQPWEMYVWGKLLGFMGSWCNSEGLRQLEKIYTVLDMKSPCTIKEVQSLASRVAAVSRFISKATDRCKPFFKVLKVGKKLQ